MTTLHKQLRHSDIDLTKTLHKSSNLTLLEVNSPSVYRMAPAYKKWNRL